MREVMVEEQVQWMLIYVQEGLGDVQKKNMIKNLEVEVLEFGMVEEFLEVIKKEFEERDDESRKVAELKQIEQGNRIMEEFVQEFWL